MMCGVTLTYGARKSKQELRIARVVGLAPSKKGLKNITFFGPGTENAQIQLLGAVVHTSNRCLAHSFLHILNVHDVLRSISQQLQSCHAWGQSTRVLRYPFFAVTFSKRYLYALKVKICD